MPAPSSPYIVIVCGSRYASQKRANDIIRVMKRLPTNSLIITGGAKGVDSIAHAVAKELGFQTKIIDAHWQHTAACPTGCREVCGPAAGPIRNRKMLDLNPNLVLAFHEDIGTSRGTADTLMEAQRRGIATKLMKIPASPLTH